MRRPGPLLRPGPSVRTRLLTGLVLLTTVFLLVMGLVSTIVFDRLEHEQFDQELALTVQSSLNAVINAPDNYAAAAVGLYNGTVTPLNGSPALKDELTEYLQELVRNGTWYSFLGSQGGVFGINPSHSPALRAATRLIQTRSRSESGGFLPPGRYFVVVAEPAKDANSHTRDLFAAEAITGTILFILVLVGGRSLIGRGLAPLEKMASTADMITTRSASAIASSRSWVTNSTALRSAVHRSSKRLPMICRVWASSGPNGSSIKSILGSRISTCARPTRLRCPPDSICG